MQKPYGLTTSGRFNCNYHKYFNNKHLIPARGGQFTPVKNGQGHWLLQIIIELFRNHKDIICLASQINAIPVFAGVILTCLSHKDPGMPIIGGSYKAEFTGLIQFR